MYGDSMWLRVSLLSVAVGLSACGGGGGGGGGTTVTKFGAAPAVSVTGLPAPTVTLSTGQLEAMVLNDLVNAYGKVAAGLAGRALGTGLGGPLAATTACAQGGTVLFTAGSPETYTFQSCSFTVGGQTYTFQGSAGATSAGGVLTLNYNNIAVTGAFTGSITGTTECRVDAGTWKCTAKNEDASNVNEFQWGWDSALTTGKANGSHSCGCTPSTWNVTFYDFDATSGRAIIQGLNSTAWIQRTSTQRFEVIIEANGVTNGPLEVIDPTP